MKKIILILSLIPSLLFSAPGDILSVVIGEDGFYADVTLEGLSDGGLYTNGLGPNNNPLTGNPRMIFNIASDGYIGSTLTVKQRKSYGTEYVRTPYTTMTINGSHTSGAFIEGETLVQSAPSTATAKLLIPASSGPKLFIVDQQGTPTTNDPWTGQTSNAVFTPTAIPVDYNYGAREHENGTNLKIRVSLSQPVYNDDSITVTMLSGFYQEAAGDGGTSNNPTSSFVVTNNSTLDYPVAGGQWDWIAGVMPASRVSGDYDVAFNARHAWGVASVRFDADGVTSLANDNETVTTITQTNRVGTGYSLTHHKATMQVAGFTSGESISLRARIYPNIGDENSVFDTNNYTTQADEVLGVNKTTIVYNTPIVYAYVDATTGNNTTGVASTTEALAAASPFQHVGEAAEGGGTLIKLQAGVHAPVGNVPEARVTTNEWRVVRPADGLTSADVTVQLDSTIRTYKVQRLEFQGVKVTLANTTSWLDGDDTAGNYLKWNMCNFDSSGVAKPSAGPNYRSYGCYFHNCTGDLGPSGWATDDLGGFRTALHFDGCQVTSTTSSIRPWYRFTCNAATGNVFLGTKTSNNPLRAQDNIMVENNTFLGQAFDQPGVTIFYDYAPTIFVSICGNIWERITSGNPSLHFAGDNRTVDCDRGIICNNTSVGDRWNFCYNWETLDSKKLTGVFVRNNIIDSLSSKHDDAAPRGYMRTGAWTAHYGVGWSGVLSAHTTGINVAGSYMNAFIGINSIQPVVVPGSHPPSSGSTSPLTYIKFVNRAAFNGSPGAGNGDYRIHTNSPAFYLSNSDEPFFPYDLKGKPRSRNGDNAGAIAEGGARRASMFFSN